MSTHFQKKKKKKEIPTNFMALIPPPLFIFFLIFLITLTSTVQSVDVCRSALQSNVVCSFVGDMGEGEGGGGRAGERGKRLRFAVAVAFGKLICLVVSYYFCRPPKSQSKKKKKNQIRSVSLPLPRKISPTFRSCTRREFMHIGLLLGRVYSGPVVSWPVSGKMSPYYFSPVAKGENKSCLIVGNWGSGGGKR